MKRNLEEYAHYCGQQAIDDIRDIARRLEGQSVVHVNSTFYGGGVAEMLSSYIPLLNDAGLDAEWRLIKGSKDFFSLTKRLHNSLQGQNILFSREDEKLYKSTMEENSRFMRLAGYDAVIVDDPQPAGLIDFYPRQMPSLFKPITAFAQLRELRKKQAWIWRAHIDTTKPGAAGWSFMAPCLEKYDAYVLSMNSFRRPSSNKPFFIIPPAIDPLSEKNRPMEESEISRILAKAGLDDEKPMITQVSRFDKWKDPIGVIDVFMKVRKSMDCQLVMLGNFATDDAEGPSIYKKVLEAAGKSRDIHIVAIESDKLVNAVQRRSDVIVQKSIREGFGLTVTEALWKGRPVVASGVGGIRLQIKDGMNGYVAKSNDEFSRKAMHLLKNPALGRQLGQAGWAHVRENFLITRLVRDELAMLESVLGSKRGMPLRSAAKLLKLPLEGMLKMGRAIKGQQDGI